MAEVWPVIHIIDRDRALRNAGIAWSCGCPGVFLISHFGDDDQVDEVAPFVRGAFPGIKIGVNYLTLQPHRAVQRSLHYGYRATWADNSGITSANIGAFSMGITRAIAKRDHAYFASVAFKGQAPERNPGIAAIQAAALGFVPTTSGAGTGIAPQVEKLASMRAQLEQYDMLAVASGITPGNVAGFLPYVTHILVASGISSNFHDFDQDKLMRLMAVVHPQLAALAVLPKQREEKP